MGSEMCIRDRLKRGLRLSRLTIEVMLEFCLWLKCELQVLRLGRCGIVEKRVSTLASCYCNDATAVMLRREFRPSRLGTVVMLL